MTVETTDDTPTWTEFGQRHFDRRITQALQKTLRLEKPTAVQLKAIPICLRGQDLLCKAATGSGKTLAYLIPLVHRILADPGPMRGIIIVPTKELSLQVHAVLSSLLTFCFDVLSADYLLPGQKYRKAELPSILVSSPSSIVALLKERNVKLTSLRMLVIDEADLLFSFGYEEDMRSLALELPTTYQAMLCSATLSTEVDELKGLVLHKPTVLEIGKDEEKGKLAQFYYPCQQSEKFLVLYALIKMRLLQGKTLMFVDNITRGYEIKLFLERFAINCSLLNSELSWEARQGVIQAFNQNIVDLCIATDDGMDNDEEEEKDEEEADENNDDFGEDMSDMSEDDRDMNEVLSDEDSREGSEKDIDEVDAALVEIEGMAREGAKAERRRRKKGKTELEGEEEGGENSEDNDTDDDDAEIAAAKAEIHRAEKKEKEQKPPKQKKKKKKDKHFSMTRGLDFVDVDNVLNVDAPNSYRAYIHRVGRTARAGKSGIALSLLTDKDDKLHRKLVDLAITELPLRLQDVERLRYRVTDVKKSVTPKEISAVRVRELQQEALNSQKLAAHFEDNPEDVKALQKNLRRFKDRKTVRQHLKYLPSYLVPTSLTAKTPVQVAVADQVGTYGGRSKKRPRTDPLMFTTTTRKKFSRAGQEAKAAKQGKDTNIEALVPLSGRKIWKLNHRKKIKRTDSLAHGGRSARMVRKTAKKFA